MHKICLSAGLMMAAALGVAQAQSTTPEATQTIANQIGMLIIQNANLADQVSQLQKQIAELRKQIPAKTPPPEPVAGDPK